MNEHFLQSKTWQKYQELEGHQTFRLTGDDFDCLAILQTTPLGNYLFCPYGPTLKSPDSLKQALKSLKTLAKKQNAFFVRIEPTFPLSDSPAKTSSPSVKALKSLGLKKSHDLDPAHTWQLDLTQPEEDILKAINKEKIRLWRIRKRKGVTIRTSKEPKDLKILTSLLNSVASRDHFIPQTEEHFKKQLEAGFATLYLADYTDPETSASTPVGAALVYDNNGTRFYAHAAADDNYRKLSIGPTLLIEMILATKKSGAKTFDFWGITTSEDPKHPWYGFTKFKKSFGGHQIDYAGTWDLPLNRLKYSFYQILRKLNRLKRKIKH